MKSISSKVVQRLKDKDTMKESVDSIVPQTHDAISVEYNPIFFGNWELTEDINRRKNWKTVGKTRWFWPGFVTV